MTLLRRLRTGWAAPALLLGLALAVHLAVDVRVIRTDRAPLVFDAGDYFLYAGYYHDLLKEHGSLAGAGRISQFRPPLPMLAAAALFLVWGVDPDVAAGVGLAALILTTVGVMILATWLRGGWTGLVAAMLVLAFPAVVGHSRLLMADLPLAAVVVASLLSLRWAALRTTELHAPVLPWAVVGLTLGVGLLTKLLFPVFVIGPLVLAIVRPPAQTSARRVLLGLGIAAAVAAIVAGPWYLNHLPDVVQFYRRTGHFSLTFGEHWFLAPSSLTLHFYRFPLDQMGPPLALLSATAVVFLAIRRVPHAGLLLTSALVPFGLLVFVALRTPRMTLPVLPVLAICTAVAADSLPRAWLRRCAQGGLAAVAVVQFLLLQFHPGASRIYDVVKPVEGARRYDRNVDTGILRPSAELWPAEQILADVRRHAGGTATLVIAPDDVLEYSLRVAARTAEVVRVRLGRRYWSAEQPEAPRCPPGRTYVVWVELRASAPGERIGAERLPPPMAGALARCSLGLEVVESFPLPDGRHAVLSVCRSSLARGTPGDRGYSGR